MKALRSGSVDRVAGANAPHGFRFVLLFCGIVVLLEAVYQATASSAVVDGFLRSLARLAAAALGLFDGEAYANGVAVRLPGYSVGVDDGCDGIQLCVLWIAAVVAFPVRLRAKLVGVGVGLIWLQAWNVVRIASLVAIGDRFGGPVFQAAHVYAWPTGLIAITIGSWLVWAYLATRPPKDT